ncbi:MAG: VWA-like domain-containing protein [Pirellulales bacterium]|nr:VWA-like domain-containing protein [Pirellulales bacterium]
MAESQDNAVEAKTVERSQKALRLAVANLPHLAGLARVVRIKATKQVPVAAVTASGLVLVNTQLFANLPMSDAAYVLAHELMHLALDTHGRQGRADPLIANFAHDYIINDILSDELGRAAPLGGLQYDGARKKSFEEWVIELSQDAFVTKYVRSWSTDAESPAYPGAPVDESPSTMSRALADAGLAELDQPPSRMEEDDWARGDVIPSSRESEFDSDTAPEQRASAVKKIRKAAAKAAGLAELKENMEKADAAQVAGDVDRGDAMIEAVRDAYHTPWQLALQKWMDALAPGERTYARPSRRGAERTDVVLPGRNRHGWTLHIILDTSGSMEEYLSAALGAIAHFCESSGVSDVHLVQCDTEVTRDEWLDPTALAAFQVSGFGYSDMQPAMRHLEDDPEVVSALMLTDGYIDVLESAPTYEMLWVLLGDLNPHFEPPYGHVLRLAT